MKRTRMDILSMICCIAGLAVGSLFLVAGIRSIGAAGWAQFGVIYIPPSAAVILLALMDLMALLKKRWAAWSWFSTIVKCLWLVLLAKSLFFIPLLFFMTAAPVIVIAVPSVWNIIRLWKMKRDGGNSGQKEEEC